MEADKYLLRQMQVMKIPYEYVRELGGEYTCWTYGSMTGIIPVWGQGMTLDESENDLIEGMKEAARVYYENAGAYADMDEKLIPCVLKVLVSSAEELKKCLIGRHSGVI